jgi:D-serine dehydratase
MNSGIWKKKMYKLVDLDYTLRDQPTSFSNLRTLVKTSLPSLAPSAKTSVEGTYKKISQKTESAHELNNSTKK